MTNKTSAAASTTTRWRAACGDKLERREDVLVISAALPIDDLEPALFRAPVLLLGAERFMLEAKEGPPQAPVYWLRKVGSESSFAPDGKVLAYDGDRHIDRRDRGRTALAWLLFIPAVALSPVLGLLPERLKVSLSKVGVDPLLASSMSLGFEVALVVACLIEYFRLGAFFSLAGFAVGSLAVFTAFDIGYRVTAHGEGRTPGLFGLAGALITFAREIAAATRGEGALVSNEAPAEGDVIDER